MIRNVGTLIGLDGTNIVNSDMFAISNSQPGELRVENIPMHQSAVMVNQQGVYTCHIPLQSGVFRDINVGIYPSGFSSKYYFLINKLWANLHY